MSLRRRWSGRGITHISHARNRSYWIFWKMGSDLTSKHIFSKINCVGEMEQIELRIKSDHRWKKVHRRRKQHNRTYDAKVTNVVNVSARNSELQSLFSFIFQSSRSKTWCARRRRDDKWVSNDVKRKTVREEKTHLENWWDARCG